MTTTKRTAKQYVTNKLIGERDEKKKINLEKGQQKKEKRTLTVAQLENKQ